MILPYVYLFKLSVILYTSMFINLPLYICIYVSLQLLHLDLNNPNPKIFLGTINFYISFYNFQSTSHFHRASRTPLVTLALSTSPCAALFHACPLATPLWAKVSRVACRLIYANEARRRLRRRRLWRHFALWRYAHCHCAAFPLLFCAFSAPFLYRNLRTKACTLKICRTTTAKSEEEEPNKPKTYTNPNPNAKPCTQMTITKEEEEEE